MSVRWRLGVLAVQSAALLLVTWAILGTIPIEETWFIAGLLAIVINRQLLEPYYPRPADVVANSVVGITLWLSADRASLSAGWNALLTGLVIAGVLGLVALAGGAGRQSGLGVRSARAALQIAQRATAQVIYSAVFWVSLLATRPAGSDEFWMLATLWFAVMAVGSLNVQRIWTGLRASGQPATVEGLIGPARLLVSGPDFPAVGSDVEIASARHSATGVVGARIRRSTDVWAELHLASPSDAESLLQDRMVDLRVGGVNSTFGGVVDDGSTVTSLSFVAAQELTVGSVVGVDAAAGEVLFQITQARIEQESVRGGSHQVTRATANQLGVFDPQTCRLVQHRWVVPPGAVVNVVVKRPGFRDCSGYWVTGSSAGVV